MKNFRLYDLSVEFYKRCTKLALPAHLKDQILRAASSVTLNIAEGYGRIAWRDKRRHYRIALGSCRESNAVLVLAEIQDERLLDMADHLAAGLYKLANRSS